jgi:hypothetical protein
MKPLDLSNASNYQRNGLVATRQGNGMPPGLRLCKVIGKGQNNTVWLGRMRDGRSVTVRIPRTNSDTQRIGNASWEFRNNAIAASIGAAPTLYDAWYVRHAKDGQKSGLHMVYEHYHRDVHALVIEAPHEALGHVAQLASAVPPMLRNMADASLLCYDLKPSNMVFRDSPFDVRFIDYGRDFCEWREYSEGNEYMERAPVLSHLQTLIDQEWRGMASAEGQPRLSRKQLYCDTIYAVMLILLSANIAFTLNQCGEAEHCTFDHKASLNFLGVCAAELRRCTRGGHVKLIRAVLRHHEIRSTLRHYMGRRNCGTKRCFTYAGFRSQRRSAKNARANRGVK